MTDRKKVFYGWFVIFAAFLNNFAVFGGINVGISIIAPNMVKDIGLDAAKIGLGFTLCQIIYALLAPSISSIVKRIGIRPLMILGNVIFIVYVLTVSFLVHNTIFFVVMTAFCGLALLGTQIPGATIAAHWFNKKFGLATSIQIMGFGVAGFVLAIILQKLIAVTGSWHVPLLTLGGLSVVTAIIIFFVVRDTPQSMGLFPDGEITNGGPAEQSSPPESSGNKDVLASPAFWILTLCGVVATAVHLVILNHALFYFESIGLGSNTGVMVITILSLMSVVGFILLGLLIDRLGPKPILAFSMFCLFIGMSLQIIALSPVIAYCGAILLGLCSAGINITLPVILSILFGPGRLTSVFGILILVMVLVGSLGTAIAGFAYTNFGSYTPPFVIMAVLGLLFGVLSTTINTAKKQEVFNQAK